MGGHAPAVWGAFYWPMWVLWGPLGLWGHTRKRWRVVISAIMGLQIGPTGLTARRCSPTHPTATSDPPHTHLEAHRPLELAFPAICRSRRCSTQLGSLAYRAACKQGTARVRCTEMAEWPLVMMVARKQEAGHRSAREAPASRGGVVARVRHMGMKHAHVGECDKKQHHSWCQQAPWYE